MRNFCCCSIDIGRKLQGVQPTNPLGARELKTDRKGITMQQASVHSLASCWSVAVRSRTRDTKDTNKVSEKPSLLDKLSVALLPSTADNMYLLRFSRISRSCHSFAEGRSPYIAAFDTDRIVPKQNKNQSYTHCNSATADQGQICCQCQRS